MRIIRKPQIQKEEFLIVEADGGRSYNWVFKFLNNNTQKKNY